MSILVGVSWIVFWTLIKVFKVEALDAALVTGVAFVLIGLVFDFAPRFTRRP